jgi:hypothetical protein
MIILGESVLTLLNIPRGAGPGVAVAPILSSGAIQRSRVVFVNAGRTGMLRDPSLMPFIGQLPQYSGNRSS